MSIAEYIGKFHPVLVHLPIGILISAIFLEGLSLTRRVDTVKATQILFIIGFISAALAATTGLLHAETGEFNPDLVDQHKKIALGVAFFSLLAVFFHGRKKPWTRIGYYVVVLIVLFLLILAGHTGGIITHGEDFLTFDPVDRVPTDSVRSDNILYADLVAPIFEQRCTGCHGGSRQKGGLRLDGPDHILKGGKDGPVIDVSTPSNGEIMRRISLDLSDEDHMPPREKRQLKKTELALISYWLNTGTSFTATLGSMPRADSLVALLHDLKQPIAEPVRDPVAAPDEEVIAALRANGVAVSFLSEGDGRISLQLMNADAASLGSLMAILVRLAPNLVELKIPGRELSHEDWLQLRNLANLERLHLEHSNISDRDIPAFSSLHRLKYLNLVGTGVSSMALANLMCPLENLYLYQTGVKPGDLDLLQSHFPQTTIVLGNFMVPTLSSDTSLVKEKKTATK